MQTQIGVLHVRRSILINASPARVWQEFESAEKVMQWLNLGHTPHDFEPRIGGNVKMSIEVNGEQRFYGGKILVFDAGSELTFESQWRPLHDWPVPTFWTIRLTPIYGKTQVEIFHHGFERLGEHAADNLEVYEEGWDIKHLKALRSIIDD